MCGYADDVAALAIFEHRIRLTVEAAFVASQTCLLVRSRNSMPRAQALPQARPEGSLGPGKGHWRAREAATSVVLVIVRPPISMPADLHDSPTTDTGSRRPRPGPPCSHVGARGGPAGAALKLLRSLLRARSAGFVTEVYPARPFGLADPCCVPRMLALRARSVAEMTLPCDPPLRSSADAPCHLPFRGDHI